MLSECFLKTACFTPDMLIILRNELIKFGMDSILQLRLSKAVLSSYRPDLAIQLIEYFFLRNLITTQDAEAEIFQEEHTTFTGSRTIGLDFFVVQQLLPNKSYACHLSEWSSFN